MSQPLTLANFHVPLPIYCLHCDRPLPKSSKVDLQKPYAVVECPKCKQMTPYMVAAA
jgi:phage FluMu protein Com